MPKTTPTRQFALLVLVAVQKDKLPELERLLETIGGETRAQMRGTPPASPILPFHKLETLHYARFVLIDAEHAADHAEGPLLVFATDYDGPEGDEHGRPKRAEAQHLQDLVEHLGSGLQRVFRCCEGYRDGRLADYLARHQLSSATFYVGASGRSRNQILWEARLRRAVDQVLRDPAIASGTPAEVRGKVRERLGATFGDLPVFPPQPDFSAKESRVKRSGIALGITLFGLLAAGAYACLPGSLGPLWRVLAALAVPALGLGALALMLVLRFRWLERNDPQFQPTYSEETRERFEKASQHENHHLQNQLSHVVRVKPGPLRWLLIRVVFMVLQFLAVHRYNRGKLGNIPSIHFARWVLGPRRSVIFLSNFDSSWQSYLGDFIDQASSGLTAVWSNTVGYPRTEWLVEAGSRDAARFLAWTRHHQVPSQVWYSAYPGLSIENINANTEIRRGLADSSALDPVTWLARLRNLDRLEADQRYAADQAESTPLRLDDVQGIILRGYGHMEEARYLLFQVREAEPARAWISRLDITSAAAGARARNPAPPLLNIAFTYEGLLKLEVERDLCARFATPFQQGSHHPYRARVNGDVGADAPDKWTWGASDRIPHVALLVYAGKHDMAAFVERFRAEAAAAGLDFLEELEGSTLKGRKEHFGFRDGIAQPLVAGSGGGGGQHNSIAAGEILLGHRDGYGNMSHSPRSSDGFAFGHNGSYLVLRQLEQDVEGFWQYCAREGQVEQAVRLASKMVGRWPSGAPLVRHPERDPRLERYQDENDFGYLEPGADNDRHGARCPFGAHIRRTNPRDWGEGATQEEGLAFSNRHRILRRGRPYGPPLDANMEPEGLIARAKAARNSQGAGAQQQEPRRGLNFLCFNANLERQFEFVQQQWCNNPKFAGQNSDADPLLGLRQPAAALDIDPPGFTLQSDLRTGLEGRAMDLPRFVRVRGSAYFFMPSLQAIRLLGTNLREPAHTPPPEKLVPDEQLHVDNLIANFRMKLARDYPTSRTLRDAHPKMHGCVQARFEVEAVPERLRCGLFKEPRSFEAWVRFSNQHHHVQHDERPDTRGLALKLLDVPGHKLLDGEIDSSAHDFIFLSHPTFVVRNVAEFDALFAAVAQNRALGYFATHPIVSYRHLRSLKRHASPLEITYFSVGAFCVGSRAVKYVVRPENKQRSRIPKAPTQDFLRETMKRQLEERDYSFGLFVQEFVDERQTPIEDASKRWQGAETLVATLHIPRQDFDTLARREFGENLSFNPWRCLPEHRPLGSVNRARRQVYQAMAAFRHDRNGVP